MDWYSAKLLVVEQTDLSRDALHIFFGLAGQVLVALVIRRSLAHPLPWLAVLLFELANEGYDLAREEWTDKAMWPGSLRDLLVTMAVPTVFLLLTRFAPSLFARAAARKGKRG
ncbi:MAG TPA: hypothetical protein VEZ20_04115 [Allosphingosinicella sp.]|jgi:hypothetical protein|nr:hypothetical protein [Allosphingosinicella sp.]